MEQEAEAPPVFCSRPPLCLELLAAENVDFCQVERVFSDEAQNLESRLREQLLQLKIELGLFLRLMYKNKNQHRRTLYYQRLYQVRRDLQMLSKSGLHETVEGFAKFFIAGRPHGVSRRAVTQSRFKDAIDESKALRTLLCVARVLNQCDGPIMAGSAQLAGLLGQSFFMPFALTMFSCLARFRVLLMHILYEVVTAFNLLSTLWQKNQKSLIYSVQGISVSPSVWLPGELECHWDGIKLSMTEKKTGSVRDSRGTVSDVPVESAGRWFVDDRTGVKFDLQIPAVVAGPSNEQEGVKSQVPLSISKRVAVVSQTEKITSFGPILEVRPVACRPDPKDIAKPPAEDFPGDKGAKARVQDVNTSILASELSTKSAMNGCIVTDNLDLRESSGQGQRNVTSLGYRHESGTSSVEKKSVAYRSISKRIVLGSSTGSVVQDSQIGAKSSGAAIVVDPEVKHKALKAAGSQYMTRSSSDQGNDPNPEDVGIEDRTCRTASIIPLSCRPRNSEVIAAVPNEERKGIELNAESTVESHHIDSVRVDAAAGTSGPVRSDVAKDNLTASLENVIPIEEFGTSQIATHEPRATLAHNDEKDDPEFLGLKSSGVTDKVGPVAAEDCIVNDVFREGTEGGRFVKNGNSDFISSQNKIAEFRPSSTSVRGNVGIDMEPNQLSEAATKEMSVRRDGPQSQCTDGKIGHSSLVFNPESAEFREAVPSVSVLNNGVECNSSLSVEEVSLMRSDTSAIPGLSSHSHGKKSENGAVEEYLMLGGSRLPRKAEWELITEQVMGSKERASTIYQENAKSRPKTAVAYISVKPDLKSPQKKREDTKRLQTLKEGSGRGKKRQLQSEIQKFPAQSGLKRNSFDTNDSPNETESKRKKTNDIFAMLLGGSD